MINMQIVIYSCVLFGKLKCLLVDEKNGVMSGAWYLPRSSLAFTMLSASLLLFFHFVSYYFSFIQCFFPVSWLQSKSSLNNSKMLSQLGGTQESPSSNNIVPEFTMA